MKFTHYTTSALQFIILNVMQISYNLCIAIALHVEKTNDILLSGDAVENFKEERDVEPYKKMYYELFNSTAKAIWFLQEVQKKTEEMFMSVDDPQETFSKSEESESSLSILKNND